MVIALVGSAGPIQGETLITGSLIGDSYITPNTSGGGSSQLCPLFAFYKDESTTFHFNAHYSTLIMKWNLEIPVPLQGESLSVTSVSLVLWQRAGAGSWNPNDGQVKLFATGVTGTNGFTAATWTESQSYIGPGAVSPTPLQDPYLVELGTNDRAEDDLNANPWTVGVVDASYDGSAVPTEAVPIRFQFDLNNAIIKQKLEDDLDAGFTMWTAGSTFFASQPGGPASDYPRIVTKEGVSNGAYGTMQQAPLLMIEVAVNSSVSDWQMY